MPHVHHVIELRAWADHGFVESAAVNGAIRPNLNVVTDHQVAHLRKLHVASELVVAHEAEAVGAEHRAGMHRDAPANRRPRINHDVRIDVAVVAYDNALAHVASGSNEAALTDDGVSFYDRVGIDAGSGRDFGARINGG